MFKLFTRLFSNNTKSKSNDKRSFVRFGAQIEGEFDENLLPTLIAWILSISITSSGAYYYISNILASSNAEPVNISNPVESIE